MTDNNATRSADGAEESIPVPIDDNLGAALALLGHAYYCAQDAHAPVWDFALEIGELYEAGLTITDLRWLVVKGLVEHGAESSAYGDAHRSFTRSDGFNFLDTTCVVLTIKGAAFARQVWRAPAATKAAQEPLNGDQTPAPGGEIPASNTRLKATLIPHWDPMRRELSLGGRIVKRFRVPARNQELILSVFQEEGWPEYIDDPLSGNNAFDPKIRLNDVVYRLNRAQIKPLIRFHTNGTGTGVHWSLCDPKPMRPRRSAAKKLIAAV